MQLTSPAPAAAPLTGSVVGRPGAVRAGRVPGPAGFYATALWLRAAFAGLHYDIHHALADGTLVAVNSTMHGRHAAP